LYRYGDEKKAATAQIKLAKMEWGFGKGGINGTKWVVAKLLNYPLNKCHCRRPYPQFTDEAKQEWISATVKPLLEEEKRLNKA
jgi:4-hydroxy-2-oxoglutarate aldolase